MTLDHLVTVLLAVDLSALLIFIGVLASVPIGDWAKSWIGARRMIERAKGRR